MLFDLALGGHHGAYLKQLVEHGCAQPSITRICVVVTPDFLTVHADVVKFFSQFNKSALKLITITQAEANQLIGKRGAWGRFNRTLAEWLFFCRYAKQLGATQAVLMYLDTYEVPLTLRGKAPCSFSGIYFRPSFHYSEFKDQLPTWRSSLQARRNRFTLERLLAHPQLTHLFCLDPFATKRLAHAGHEQKAIYLPDPVDYCAAPSNLVGQLREQLNVWPNRRVFLLFGALDSRKGIYQLLEAIHHLDGATCQQMCLVLAGKTDPDEQVHIQMIVQQRLREKPIQIIEQYEFIPNRLSSAYFQLADIVLAPYQHHVGMSGILLTAAAAGKPVLSSCHGLMGQLTRIYELGLTVEAQFPEAIARGIVQCLNKPTQALCDPSRQKALVKQHDPEHFSQTIFQYIL